MSWKDILKVSSEDAIRDARRAIDVDEEDYYFSSDKLAMQDYRDEIKLLQGFKEKIEANKDSLDSSDFSKYKDYSEEAMRMLRRGSNYVEKQSRTAWDYMHNYMKEKMAYYYSAPSEIRFFGKEYFKRRTTRGEDMPEETFNPKSKTFRDLKNQR